MAKKPATQFDILAVGNHPSAYLVAAAAKVKQPKLSVGHVSLPGELSPDRLTLANPTLFALHELLEPLKKTFGHDRNLGALFLSEQGSVRGDYTSKTPTCLVTAIKPFNAAVAKLAREAGVAAPVCKASFEVKRVIDDGAEVWIDDKPVTTRMLIVASPLSPASGRQIGHAFTFDADVMQQYHFATLRSPPPGPGKQLVMSLDLAGTGAWGWLLQAGETAQVAVMQPVRRPPLPAGRELALWMANLADHGILSKENASLGPATTIQLPAAGALSGETVANRTLLVGPAGGFISACNEDLYPGCWSAIIAADVAVKALKERHVQDSLLSFREKWGSTVGDYLRGPQQNLKLLLPLIYRNPMMAARVGEAIFLGESIVR